MSGGSAGSAITSGCEPGPPMAGGGKGVANGEGIRPARAAFGSGSGEGKLKREFGKGVGDGTGLGAGFGLGMGEGKFKRGLEVCAFATGIGATARIRTTRMLESGRMTGPSIAVPNIDMVTLRGQTHCRGPRLRCIDRNCAISLNLPQSDRQVAVRLGARSPRVCDALYFLASAV
jgi:hypothetical protein